MDPNNKSWFVHLETPGFPGVTNFFFKFQKDSWNFIPIKVCKRCQIVTCFTKSVYIIIIIFSHIVLILVYFIFDYLAIKFHFV